LGYLIKAQAIFGGKYCLFLGILKFRSGFMQMFSAFRFSFEDVLAFFGLATVLATLSNIWAIFPPIFSSPCS
jgi:hypothetical protein